MLKSGDIVECINDEHCPELNIGTQYTILRTDRLFVYLDKNYFDGYYPSRFRKLPDPPQTTFSSGGPYVARSEYDRVCGELEALKEGLKDTMCELEKLYLGSR
jgi:hypothetical protein